MYDSYGLPERSSSRVSDNSESQRAEQSNYGFHQGEAGANPNWDPYGFHQRPGQAGSDRVPPVSVPREVPLPPLPEAPKQREIRLPDGALNVTDEQGRVIFTGSADGSKTREVRYEDSNDPQKVTQVIIDRSRVYTRNADGKSWAYTIDGRPAGTWYGDVQMSPQGVYSLQDYSTRMQRSFAPNTTEIVDRVSMPAVPRQADCRPCQPSSNCNEQVRYYRPGDSSPYYNQATQSYYERPTQNQWEQYYNPAHERNYYRTNYNSSYNDCSYNNYNQRQSFNGAGGQFGQAVLAGALGYGMPRYGGFYPGGFYPGGFYPGGFNPGRAYYNPGNMAGAMIGSLIGRAIMGGGRRGGRW